MAAVLEIALDRQHLGMALDVLVALIASMRFAWAGQSWRKLMSARNTLALCAIDLALSISIHAERTIAHTAFMVAALALAMHSLNCPTGSHIGLCLHLIRAFRIAFEPSPLLPAATAASFVIHVALAWRLVDRRLQQHIKTHLGGILALKGIALVFRYYKQQKQLYVEDMHDPASEETYHEGVRNTEFDPTKRLFVIRATILKEWKAVTALVAASTLMGVALHYRRMVFVNILAIIGDQVHIDRVNLASQLIVWQMLALCNPAKEYIATAQSRISLKIMMMLESKALEIYTTSRSDVVNSWMLHERISELGQGLGSLTDAAGVALAEVLNVWIVASRIGWRFIIPVLLVFAHELLAHLVRQKIERLEKESRKRVAPRISKNFHNLARDIRGVKLYAWENVFRDVRIGPDIDKYKPPLFWRIVKILIDLVGSAISQIASAIAITSSIQSSGITSYTDVMLLMGSIDSLTRFGKTVSTVGTIYASIKKSTVFLSKIVTSNVNKYIQLVPEPSTISAELNGCTFSWERGAFSVDCQLLSIGAGEFVAIVGRVGSGKSSLIAALCGEMPMLGGQGRLCGKIGFVDQKPTVFNTSFRENVLLGEEFDEQWFKRVIDACALTQDLEQLENGDLTNVGFGGVNLSGGQKVRLALARAIYRKADIYILDDLLSAVDAHVERHIIENVLVGSGIISSKTRILVTHADHVVPLSDKVVTLSEGRVDVIDQTPALFSTVLAGADAAPDLNTDTYSEKPTEKPEPFVIHPDYKNPPLRWVHFQKYLALSGYWRVAAVAAIQMASAYAVFYIDSIRIDLMTDSNTETMVQSLKHYLLINAFVEILHRQLQNFGTWAQEKLWSRPLLEKMRQAVLDAIVTMPLTIVEMLSYSGMVNMFYWRQLPSISMPKKLTENVLSDGLTALLSIIRVATVVPTMLWAAVPLMLTIVVLFRRYSGITKFMTLLVDNKAVRQAYWLEEMIYFNIKLVRIHNISDGLLKKYNILKSTEMNFRAASKSICYSQTLATDIATELVKSFVLASKLWQRFGLNMPISAGEVDVATTSSVNMLNRVSQLASVDHSLHNVFEHMTKYFLHTEELAREAPMVIESSRPPKQWPSQGRIVFEDYSMRYRPNSNLVLCNLSFSVGCQEKVGVVGRTGAGKSSLTQAIMRMVESASGRVIIDGIDVSTIGVHDLRSRISIIPQDPTLFYGTIRDNLDPKNEYTDKEVWAAIRKTRIEYLLEKPMEKYKEDPDDDDDDNGIWLEGVGLEKWVMYSGRNFSVGERQLLSLCRALLWQRKIVILDEATANIDGNTDQLIQTILRKEFKDCTMLTIAHRLDTVMDYDRILVMDQGRVAEFDTPQNLLARDSHFSQLVASMKLNRGG